MSKLQKIGIIGGTILVIVLITYIVKPFKQFSNFKNVDVINFVDKTFVSSDLNYAIRFLSEDTFRFQISNIENNKVVDRVIFDDSFVLNDGSITSKEKALTFVVYSSDTIYSIDYHKSLFLVNDYEK